MSTKTAPLVRGGMKHSRTEHSFQNENIRRIYGWGFQPPAGADTPRLWRQPGSPALLGGKACSPPVSPTALDPFTQSPGTHFVTRAFSAKPIQGMKPEDSCNHLQMASILSSLRNQECTTRSGQSSRKVRGLPQKLSGLHYQDLFRWQGLRSCISL